MKLVLQSKRNLLEKEEFNLRIFYDESQRFYKVCAYNTKKEEVARATFKLNYRPNKHIWLYKISTNDNQQHKGYATAVLYTMEYIAKMNRFDQIEAKFYPDNEFAKPFYDKHDYIIFKDGYETYLTKSLDYEFIKTEIEPNISDYSEEKMPELER